MTDQISLTAAELAFLLSVAEGAMASRGMTASPASTLLGLAPEDRNDALVAAGVGSLLLRHLAAPVAGQRVELAPEVAAVADGLAQAQMCARLGLVAAERADGALLFDTGLVRFLVAPRAFRCFDVTGVDPTVDGRDPLVTIAAGFLESHRPGVASFNVLSADPDTGWATVAAGDDGHWTFVAGRDEQRALRGLTADEALTHVYHELGELMPQMVRA